MIFFLERQPSQGLLYVSLCRPVSYRSSIEQCKLCRRKRLVYNTQLFLPLFDGKKVMKRSCEFATWNSCRLVASSEEEEYVIREDSPFKKPPSKFVDREFPPFERLQSWEYDEEVEAFWKEFRHEQLDFRGLLHDSDDNEKPEPISLDWMHQSPQQSDATAVFDWLRCCWKPSNKLCYEEPPSFEEYLSMLRGKIKYLERQLSHETPNDEIEQKLEILRKFVDLNTRCETVPFSPGRWRLSFLGTSSALPTLRRNVSSLALRVRSRWFVGKEDAFKSTREYSSLVPEAMFLVDCGEMTFRRLVEAKWHSIFGFRFLRAIFITHLHGDHVWGLPVLMERIGFYTQHQQRYMKRVKKMPILHIFGPQGLRLFLRTALCNTFLGFNYCVHELIPHSDEFDHVEPWCVPECLLDDDQTPATYLPLLDRIPGKHSEEVIGEDVQMNKEEKRWNLCIDELFEIEVSACPLRHRVPCWGYYFKELTKVKQFEEKKHLFVVSFPADSWNVSEDTDVIDKKFAYSLGVRGRQFQLLRQGKPVQLKTRKMPIEPKQVDGSIRALEKKAVFGEFPVFRKKDIVPLEPERDPRSILILGDTVDSTSFLEVARHCDAVIHEATFSEGLEDKAVKSFHSTSRMAGQFATLLSARALILTHFSSRYEMYFYKSDGNALNEDTRNQDVPLNDNNDDDDTRSVMLLADEARNAYSLGPVYLAQDYLTFDLDPHSASQRCRIRHLSSTSSDFKAMRHKTSKGTSRKKSAIVRSPVEFSLDKPMSSKQWKKLKGNVAVFSKDSLFELLKNSKRFES
eukprot:jgi/Galph1/319/GphlegSOOS_G5092.1